MSAKRVTDYGFGRVVNLTFDAAVERTKACLKEQGFGVLSEIDVQKAMKEKLGKDIPPYLILGACNPPLAFQAIEGEPEIGLLLPCNVLIKERDGGVEVSMVDAAAMMGVTGNEALQPIAAKAGAGMKAALDAI